MYLYPNSVKFFFKKTLFYPKDVFVNKIACFALHREGQKMHAVVGTHKTASATIQRMCFANRSHITWAMCIFDLCFC